MRVNLRYIGGYRPYKFFIINSQTQMRLFKDGSTNYGKGLMHTNRYIIYNLWN